MKSKDKYQNKGRRQKKVLKCAEILVKKVKHTTTKMRTMLCLLLAQFLLLQPSLGALSDGGVGRACPARCECTQTEILCSGKGLKEVPKDLPVGDRLYTRM